jgi:hypothetical protein
MSLSRYGCLCLCAESEETVENLVALSATHVHTLAGKVIDCKRAMPKTLITEMHERERLERAAAAGMLTPNDRYEIAKRRTQCSPLPSVRCPLLQLLTCLSSLSVVSHACVWSFVTGMNPMMGPAAGAAPAPAPRFAYPPTIPGPPQRAYRQPAPAEAYAPDRTLSLSPRRALCLSSSLKSD